MKPKTKEILNHTIIYPFGDDEMAYFLIHKQAEIVVNIPPAASFTAREAKVLGRALLEAGKVMERKLRIDEP